MYGLISDIQAMFQQLWLLKRKRYSLHV